MNDHHDSTLQSIPDPLIRHYVWAGLDFLFDRDGCPVLIEANRSSHMLGEYLEFVGDHRPFQFTADVMNSAGGVPCVLWRRHEHPDTPDENAPFVSNELSRWLEQPPVICNVEDNTHDGLELRTRDGKWVRPGSIFRWWYGLSWSFERSGVRVVNPNAAWVVVRDKWNCYQAISRCCHGAGPSHFRLPWTVAVNSAAEAATVLQQFPERFPAGYVLKPRIGWGGAGVQVADCNEPPNAFTGEYLLTERIIPQRMQEDFWEVRAFVMAGNYLGGILHRNRTPNTNYWQGGRPQALPSHLNESLTLASLEAVRLIDAAADQVHTGPIPRTSRATHVDY